MKSDINPSIADNSSEGKVDRIFHRRRPHNFHYCQGRSYGSRLVFWAKQKRSLNKGEAKIPNSPVVNFSLTISTKASTFESPNSAGGDESVVIPLPECQLEKEVPQSFSCYLQRPQNFGQAISTKSGTPYVSFAHCNLVGNVVLLLIQSTIAKVGDANSWE
ncbi:hypothetical protein PIB30_050296 [Stylosanthes scabra]|uniref:Uncharacterized protein n=1 Tax=Stylosanthes scabra TaxID=79078 RepID=A0ABU6YF02_9FABA|nr:hypothetical protein [Stylosanthes scabra]